MKNKLKLRKIVFILIVLMVSIAGVISVNWLRPNVAIAESNLANCEYHGIDINLCSRCNPELIPEFKASGDWCGSHNLPESQCDLCGFGAVHEGESGHDDHESHNELETNHEDHDHDHGTEDNHSNDQLAPIENIHDHQNEMANYKDKSEFSVFFPENAFECPTDGAVIQLASIKTAERTGLTIRPAIEAEYSSPIIAPAEIVLDETKNTVLTTMIPSLVTQWLAEPGQKVARGDLIARLSSPELPEMKAEFIESHATRNLASKRLERQKELYKKGLISDSEYEDSETEFAVADAQLTGRAGLLKSAGLSDSDLQSIIGNKLINQTMNIYAPVDGIIIERIASLGQLLEEGSPLAIIGDPESLWIEVQVKEKDVSYFKIGDNVVFSSDGNGINRCSGEIIWIAQFLDKKTRTLTVRAKLASSFNPVHSGEFGRVYLDSYEKQQAVLIPEDAVQWEGCCNVVFVKETIDRFRPRKVRVESGENGYYHVVEGLRSGEEIVVDGSFLLKTELRKGALGAGCCGI